MSSDDQRDTQQSGETTGEPKQTRDESSMAKAKAKSNEDELNEIAREQQATQVQQ